MAAFSKSPTSGPSRPAQHHRRSPSARLAVKAAPMSASGRLQRQHITYTEETYLVKHQNPLPCCHHAGLLPVSGGLHAAWQLHGAGLLAHVQSHLPFHAAQLQVTGR